MEHAALAPIVFLAATKFARPVILIIVALIVGFAIGWIARGSRL
jgi:hypothetical protein